MSTFSINIVDFVGSIVIIAFIRAEDELIGEIEKSNFKKIREGWG